MNEHETVYTITDWYDGARGGIADLYGKPHYFENQWNESEQQWSEIYYVILIDDETFALAIEDWEIWLRWEQAFKEGKTNLETHPALSEDKRRHEQLEKILVERLVISSENSIKATAEFVYGRPTKVKWQKIED